MDQHANQSWDAQAEQQPAPQAAVPAPPAYVLAHIFQANEVTLLWKDSADAEGYIIHRGEDPKTIHPIAPAKETTFTDKSVQPGVTYYYAVHAYNAQGQSKPSDPAAVKLPGQSNSTPPASAPPALTPPPTLPPQQPLPQTPSSLCASTQGTRLIQLSWQVPQQGLQFRIYRSETPWNCYSLIAETNDMHYVDHAPEAATRYYYFIQSVQGSRASQASAMVEALTLPALPPPDTPQSLRTQSSGADAIELRWNHARCAAAYAIFARVAPSNEFSVVGHSLNNGWLHENLPPDTQVDYRVQAYHDSGASLLSAVCSSRSAAPRNRSSQKTNFPGTPERRFPSFSPQAFQRN